MKIVCTDEEESSVTSKITLSITKRDDDIHEISESRQQINAVYSGNCVMHYTPQETSSYTLILRLFPLAALLSIYYDKYILNKEVAQCLQKH